jgi:hypothetical protein
MKVLRTGHQYELANLEQDLPECNQRIQFIEKEPKSSGSCELSTVRDGTTNEEVLGVLIDRLQYLQGKMACRENAIVITKLEECLMWLNKRRSDRLARNVLGMRVK